MSSEARRATVVFGVVGVIAAASGYYFFGVYHPREVRRDARAEVTGWEARWTAARACLLGAAPGSSKTSEALAIHELSPDPWDRGVCTGLVSKLVRGDAPDTGLVPVEAAWRTLDRAATKAAAAFATHVVHGGDPLVELGATMPAPDELPAALDALDAARAALRTSVGLPAAESGGMTPLPAAQLVPVGADPLEHLALADNGHGMVTIATAGGHFVQVVVPAGGTPRVIRVPDNGRATADGSWGAGIDSAGQLVAGALDGSGAAAATATAKVPASLANAPSVIAASGSQADGRLAISALSATGGQELGFATVHGATVTFEPAIAAGRITSSADADGHALVLWTAQPSAASGAADPPFHTRILGTGDGVANLPITLTGRACVTGDHAWLDGDGAVYVVDGSGTVSAIPVEASRLIGCTPDGAVFYGPPGEGVRRVCTGACRDVRLPRGPVEPGAFTTVGGKLVALVEHGGVIETWREDGAPTYRSLPAAAAGFSPALHVAFTDGKVLDLLVRDEAGHYAVVRVPAS